VGLIISVLPISIMVMTVAASADPLQLSSHPYDVNTSRRVNHASTALNNLELNLKFDVCREP
jgi:hypothetical protein